MQGGLEDLSVDDLFEDDRCVDDTSDMWQLLIISLRTVTVSYVRPSGLFQTLLNICFFLMLFFFIDSQVAHGSKEWRATKRQERDEEEAAAAAALLEETADAPLPLMETPIAGLNPTRNGKQRTRAKHGKKSGSPGAGVENIGGELGGGGGQTGSGTGSRAISLIGAKLSKLNLGFTKKSSPKEKPQRGYL